MLVFSEFSFNPNGMLARTCRTRPRQCWKREMKTFLCLLREVPIGACCDFLRGSSLSTTSVLFFALGCAGSSANNITVYEIAVIMSCLLRMPALLLRKKAFMF